MSSTHARAVYVHVSRRPRVELTGGVTVQTVDSASASLLGDALQKWAGAGRRRSIRKALDGTVVPCNASAVGHAAPQACSTGKRDVDTRCGSAPAQLCAQPAPGGPGGIVDAPSAWMWPSGFSPTQARGGAAVTFEAEPEVDPRAFSAEEARLRRATQLA
jgi:hypothetical protein